MELTGRQASERRFYDTYSKVKHSTVVDFEPVLGNKTRPGNSYWYVAGLVRKLFVSPDQRLLDFGCGSGYCSMQYARVGYRVFGFDISPGNIEAACSLAGEHGFDRQTEFKVGTAEALEYPSSFFDVVVGVDILHHVDISQAIRECARVLRPGGTVIFHEPVRAPVFDYLRETRLGMWLVPRGPSIESEITEFERKLDKADLAVLAAFDPALKMEPFFLTARLARFVKGTHRALESLDRFLFRWLPPSRRFAGRVVIMLTPTPHKSA